MPPPDDAITYRLLKTIQADPRMTQRAMSGALDVSLGKINYCLRALIDQGWIKAKRFRESNNKISYAYILTPQGLEEKGRVTLRFLGRKIAEYEKLQQEIEQLRQEMMTSPAQRQNVLSKRPKS